MKRYLAILLFLMFSISLIFCNKWFVCLGSFKAEQNAINFVKLLEEKGFKAGIDKQFINGELFNRVLLKIDFDDINLAREKRDVVLNEKGLLGLKLKDLWLCVPSQKFYENYKEERKDRVAHHLLEKPITLQKNTQDIPISEQIPYSILVNKYKEESVAENDKKRLESKKLEAYIIKTYDDEDFFSFNLHVGAFKTQDEAEQTQEKLKELGLEEGKIVDYNDIVKAIQKYDEVVVKEEVKYQDGQKEIPTSFSQDVATCIKEFPINKDFQIEEIHIFDLDNIRNFGSERVNISKIEGRLYNEEKTHATSIAFYKDSLFNKKVEILIQTGEDGSYIIEDNDGKKIELQANGNNLLCNLTQEDGTWFLSGTNEEGNLFVSMKSEDFDEKEFELFLNNVSNDSSLLAYPQIRKTLLVLPKENEKVKRNFLHFTLEKVDSSYAREKGYAKWAIPMVGHWQCHGYFNQEEEKVSVTFFDLDYDKIAKNLHSIFMKTHENAIITDNNTPVSLEHADGWFVKTYASGEVSFSCKSYVIAINSYSESIGAKMLMELGDDLQIWE